MLNFSCPLGSACTAGAAPDPAAAAPLELAGADELLAGAADEVAAGAADEDEDEDEDEEPQAVTPRAVMIRTATAAMRGTGPP